MLEHARWNAAHSLLGYVDSHADEHSCDERTLHHNCLKDWDKLSDESTASKWDYKAYDFCVIETSIAIINEEMNDNS